MKKVFLCIFLILGFMLIPKINVSADSIVDDVYDDFYADNLNMYFYTLPDLITYYDSNYQSTILHEIDKVYTPSTYDIDTSIDNGIVAGVVYSPCDVYNDTTYSEFSFSSFTELTTTVDLVWYDFYYTPELYSNTDIPLIIDTITYTLSYYNELGRITTIEYVINDNTSSLRCFPIEFFDSAYKRNDIVKVSSFVINYYGKLPYFSTNKHIESNSRDVLDLGSTYHRPISNSPNNINVGTWLKNSLESFLSFELVPGFALADILALLVTIPLAIWILRMFMGGQSLSFIEIFDFLEYMLELLSSFSGYVLDALGFSIVIFGERYSILTILLGAGLPVYIYYKVVLSFLPTQRLKEGFLAGFLPLGSEPAVICYETILLIYFSY